MQRRTLLRAGLGGTAAALVAACSSGRDSPSPPAGTGTGSPGTGSPRSPSPAPTGQTSEAAEPEPPTGTPHVTNVLAHDVDVPWGIAFLPDGNALVSERDTGRVLRVHKEGGHRVVGTVPGVVGNVSLGGEGGLLGLALHPRFPQSRWVYAYLSSRSDNRVVRMRYRDGRLGPPRAVVTGIRKAVHHNGGGLAFGPDGMLYVSTGDAEVSSDAQDRQSLNGKILRVTPRGRAARGNPFDNRVWSYGHRNVEGIAFDDSGRLWASEFGEHDQDELNHIVEGGNYGWPAVEGKDGPGGYRDPLAQWDTDRCSPSGIAVLGGRAWLAALQGECLYAVRLSGAHRGRQHRYLAGRYGRLRMVAAAPDGSLWLGTSNRDGRGSPARRDDRILRLGF